MGSAILVLSAVSAALVIGALWGTSRFMPPSLRGFLVALAGGALIVSATIELIEPSYESAGLLTVVLATAAGAALFTGADWLLERTAGSDSGFGLLAAITFDGVPENLALGVVLISSGPLEAAALAGAILLSNLPEAAGGAQAMLKGGRGRGVVIAIWTAVAAVLTGVGFAGNLLLGGASAGVIAVIQCLAAGAVISSLATEVFPQAYEEEHIGTGIAVAIGVIAAFALHTVGG